MDERKRKTARGWRDQLLTLVNGWDPAGVLAAGAPRDEYDWILDELLRILSRDATADEVARFLESEIARHFGREPAGAAQFATKAVNWFRIAWAEQ